MTGTELDTVDDPPAFKALTSLEKSFVEAYVDLGGTNGSKAARLAGYSDVGSNARRRAHQLLRLPRILAAIKELANNRLSSSVAMAATTLVDIANDHNVADATRYKASVKILELGGIFAVKVSEHNINITDNRSDAEVIARIKQLAGVAGVPVPDITDVEFEEIEEDEWAVDPE